MSKYSSKRQAPVACSDDAACITPADHLVLIRGIPSWVCTAHWQERQPKKVPLTYNPYVEFLTDAELPTGRPPRRDLREFAQRLRDNPGLWSPYPSGATSSPGTTVWRINHERTGSLSCDEFEAIERKGEIYVRYHPKEQRG